MLCFLDDQSRSSSFFLMRLDEQVLAYGAKTTAGFGIILQSLASWRVCRS